MINPNNLRKHVLRMVFEKKSGHIGGSFSLAEVISYLYSNFNLTSNEKDSPKLILSKGHAVPIIYAVLYELNKITDTELSLFREIDSPLQGHPDKHRLKFFKKNARKSLSVNNFKFIKLNFSRRRKKVH